MSKPANGKRAYPITNEERERLQQIVRQNHRRSVDHVITDDDCRDIRTLIDEYGSATKMAKDRTPSLKKIRVHLNGDCDHDIDVPPRTYIPGTGWVPKD